PVSPGRSRPSNRGMAHPLRSPTPLPAVFQDQSATGVCSMRTLRRARLFMLAAMLVAGLSCSTDQPTTPLSTPETPDQLLGGLSGLLSCPPLPADSAEQTVGPEGGSITVGPHTLVVPAGALNQETVITATVPSDSVNSVILGPQGLTFAPGKPA